MRNFKLWFFTVMLAFSSPAMAVTYQEFAASLLNNLPDGSEINSDLEEALADSANRYRQENGIPPLIKSNRLRDAARAHAIDMMENDFMGHRASTGHDFDSRMRTYLGNLWPFPAMAENAVRDSQKTMVNQKKIDRMVQQWVDSPPHRRNLRNQTYRYFSTGLVKRGTHLWAVQIFWNELPEPGEKRGMFNRPK